MEAATTTSRLHEQALAAPIREMVGVLQEVLTQSLTAYIADVDDTGVVGRWASGEESSIDDHAVERRLRASYEAVLLLLMFDAPRTIRAWFTGMSPELGDIAPVDAIRAGKLDDVLSAATAFTVNG